MFHNGVPSHTVFMRTYFNTNKVKNENRNENANVRGNYNKIITMSFEKEIQQLTYTFHGSFHT